MKFIRKDAEKIQTENKITAENYGEILSMIDCGFHNKNMKVMFQDNSNGRMFRVENLETELVAYVFCMYRSEVSLFDRLISDLTELVRKYGNEKEYAEFAQDFFHVSFLRENGFSGFFSGEFITGKPSRDEEFTFSDENNKKFSELLWFARTRNCKIKINMKESDQHEKSIEVKFALEKYEVVFKNYDQLERAVGKLFIEMALGEKVVLGTPNGELKTKREFRGLVNQTNETQAEIAEKLGMSARGFRMLLSDENAETSRGHNYCQQYAVESMVNIVRANA